MDKSVKQFDEIHQGFKFTEIFCNNCSKVCLSLHSYKDKINKFS